MYAACLSSSNNLNLDRDLDHSELDPELFFVRGVSLLLARGEVRLCFGLFVVFA